MNHQPEPKKPNITLKNNIKEPLKTDNTAKTKTANDEYIETDSDEYEDVLITDSSESDSESDSDSDSDVNENYNIFRRYKPRALNRRR